MRLFWILNFLLLSGLVACDEAPPPQPLAQEAGEELDDQDDEEQDDSEYEDEKLNSETIETQELSPREIVAELDPEVVEAIESYLESQPLDLLEAQIEEDRVAYFKEGLDDAGNALSLPDDQTLGASITYFLQRKVDEVMVDPADSQVVGEDPQPQAVAPPAATAAVDTSKVTIYRNYNNRSSDHMFSHSQTEGPNAGYTLEPNGGFKLYVHPAEGRHPIYRCFNEGRGDHFLSDVQGCEGSKEEGILGYALTAAGEGTVEMHRCYRDRLKNSFTTANLEECTNANYQKVKTIGFAYK